VSGVWRVLGAPKDDETPISHRALRHPWSTHIGDPGRIVAQLEALL